MTGPLLIHRDTAPDWLAAYELGVVEDGQPERNWHITLSTAGCSTASRVDGCSALTRAPSASSTPSGGTPRVSSRGPTFNVPTLGLAKATIGEICLAARSIEGGVSASRPAA